MAIDLHIGHLGPEGPDAAPAGSIGEKDLSAARWLARAVGLEIELAPTADFSISAEEVAHAAGQLDEAVRAFEANGADAATVDLCAALRRAADEGQGLSGYGD